MQWIYWLLAVLLSAGAALWVYRSDKLRAVPLPWLTALLRGLVVFFTLLLVLVPTFLVTKTEIEKPVIVLLQDDSRSVAVALGKDSTSYRANTEKLLQRLSYQYKVVKWGFGGAVQHDTAFNYVQPATDIANALAEAQEFYGLQNLGAVLLASDGKFNQGSNPLYQQIPLHAPVYTIAIGDSTVQKDLRIAQTYANKVVTINSSFEIRADILAQKCRGYSDGVVLKEANNMVGSVPLAITTDKFDRAVSFTVKAEKAGLHHYILTVPVAAGELNTTNNRKDIFVEVTEEKKHVLIASAAPHPDVNAIKEALMGLNNYDITVSTIDNFPPTLTGYDVIILHGLPSLRNDLSVQLRGAHKPIWFIITPQTNLPALNALRESTGITVSPSPAHDVMATYNNAFSTFNVPRQIQSVTDKMPPLSVNAGNILVPPGSNALFTQKTGAGDFQSPVWLLQQGSSPVAMLAGEGIWRWRLYEFKNFGNHDVIDECIRQTVSFLSVNNRERPFTTGMVKYVWRDQEPVTIKAYLRNGNNEQINTPDASLTVTDSAGKKHEFAFERTGTTYGVNIGIWAGGTYTYVAKTTMDGKALTSTGTFAVESVPAELMEQGADYNLLFGIAKKYSGAFTPAAGMGSLYDSIVKNTRIKPLIRENTEMVPIVDRKWYFFLILLVAVAEWLLRKYWLAQ